METSQMYIVRKRYKEYAARNKVTLRRSKFTQKVYVNMKDTARQVAIHNCKIQKMELRLGSYSSATYIWVKATNSLFSGKFDLLSAYRNSFILVEFIGCSIEGNILIDAQADEDENEVPADAVVNFRRSSFTSLSDRKWKNRNREDKNNLRMYNITRVNIRGCKFSGVDIAIFGRDADKRRCCSDVTLKKSRLSNTRLLCRHVSLEIARSRFRVSGDSESMDIHYSDDSMLNWVSSHGTRFTAVDATFNASNTQGSPELISVSRKNAVMENVQLLCPVKVTADLTNTTKYKLLCTTQCIHNEYKVRDITKTYFRQNIFRVYILKYINNHSHTNQQRNYSKIVED